MREGFYRAFKSKGDAKEAAAKIRKETRMKPVVRFIKHFFSDGRSAYGVYVYK